MDLIGVSHPLKRSPNHQATGRLGPAVMGAVSKPPKTPATTWVGATGGRLGACFKARTKAWGNPSSLHSFRPAGEEVCFFVDPPKKRRIYTPDSREDWYDWMSILRSFVNVSCSEMLPLR